MDTQNIENDLDQVVTLLKALANDKRLLIICALVQGEKNVTELEEIVDLSQSALSQHLSKLRHDNLVSTRRNAQTIYYSVKCKNVKKIIELLCDLCCQEQKERLEA